MLLCCADGEYCICQVCCDGVILTSVIFLIFIVNITEGHSVEVVSSGTLLVDVDHAHHNQHDHYGNQHDKDQAHRYHNLHQLGRMTGYGKEYSGTR